MMAQKDGLTHLQCRCDNILENKLDCQIFREGILS